MAQQPFKSFDRPLMMVSISFTLVGLGGLGVTCSPRDPRFAGSNPAEVDGFFQDEEVLSTSSPGRDFKLGVQSLRFQAR